MAIKKRRRGISTQSVGYFTTVLSLATTITITLLATVLLNSASAAPGQGNPPAWAEGRILLKVKDGFSDTNLAAELNRMGAKPVAKIQQISAHIVHVPAQAELAVTNALRHLPWVEFAELDMLLPLEQTPNDPQFSSQWHLPKINAPTAWDSATGKGVVVAVLDTGVNIDHADLQGQLLAGWNAVDQSNNYSDVQGHGTLVSGTIAATTNNGTGVASIAHSAKILPIRVSNTSDGYAYYSDIARGLSWAADNGARVANISYNVTTSSTITQAAQYLIGKGGLVTVSAGNSGSDLGYADNKSMISVSATASNDTLASWSSYGNYVDVSAPGVGIYTTNSSGGYSSVSGTSFSAPTTAGVIALIMSANSALTPVEVENILESSATDLGSAGWDKQYGYGRVDAAAAVAKALNSQTIVSDTQPPTVSMNLSSGTTVSGTQTITVNAADDTSVAKVELWIGGKLLNTDTASPYSFSWNTTTSANGTVVVEAKAYDGAGNIASAQASVTVNNVVIADTTPPTVEFASPTNGATISGMTKFSIVASDNIAVRSVACYIDNKLVTSTTSTSLICSMNSRKYSTGAHSIMAKAVDTSGNTASTAISVNVVR